MIRLRRVMSLLRRVLSTWDMYLARFERSLPAIARRGSMRLSALRNTWDPAGFLPRNRPAWRRLVNQVDEALLLTWEGGPNHRNRGPAPRHSRAARSEGRLISSRGRAALP